MKLKKIENVSHANWSGEYSDITLHIHDDGMKFWFEFYDTRFTVTLEKLSSFMGEDNYSSQIDGDGWSDPLHTQFIEVPEGTGGTDLIIERAARRAVAYIAMYV